MAHSRFATLALCQAPVLSSSAFREPALHIACVSHQRCTPGVEPSTSRLRHGASLAARCSSASVDANTSSVRDPLGASNELNHSLAQADEPNHAPAASPVPTPLDPARPWLVHPRRSKISQPVASSAAPSSRAPSEAEHSGASRRSSLGQTVPGQSVAHSAAGAASSGDHLEAANEGEANLEGAKGPSEIAKPGDGFNGYFPHSSELHIGPSAVLSSREVLALLGPFMVEERRRRMRAVVENRTVAVVPVVEGLSDLGNVSAVCRTSDGLGFQNVHVISNKTGRARLFRNNRRVSMGSDKWLDVETWADTEACLSTLKQRGYRVAVTSLGPTTVPIYDMDWTVPTAIVFGNEHQGVTQKCVEMADMLVSIPMLGMVESFNISVAAALVLHHAMRDRIARKGCHGDLTEEQREALLAHYALRHRGEQSQSLIEHLVTEQVERAKEGGVGTSPGAYKGAQRRMREILSKEAVAAARQS